ncbi:MAG TPA: type II secretion system protein GspL [Candidatus Binataceae bacterium]|nr:type II secretion system protein GspL [Candidatus Binataceae bacterium]
MPQKILALEMPGHTIRAAVAERTWNTFHIEGVFEEQRRDGETDLEGALHRILARTGKPDVVTTSIASDFVVKRLLELPFSDMRKLHQVVPFALEEHLPFPVDDAVVAFVRVGADRGSTLVVAALARKTDMRHHLDLLAKVGIDPRTVTLSELAIARLLSRSPTSSTNAHLLMDIEPTSTSMVLLDSDGTPRAIRTVHAGLSAEEEGPVAEAHANAILGTARQTLLAHSSEVEGIDVILAGSAAGIPLLRDELSQALSLAVRDAAEFDYSFLLNGKRPDMSRYAACIAMLLSELPNKPAELLNFRAGEFAFKGRVRGDLTAFYTTATIAAVAIVLGLAHFALGVGTQLHRLHALDRQIATIAVPALGSHPPDDAVAALRSGIIKMSKRLALIGGNIAKDSPLDALLAVSRDVPKRFPLEMQDITVDDSGVLLSGEADSFATVDQMKQVLQKDDYFSNIEVSHTKAAQDGKVEFQVQAKFKDAITTE